MVFLPLAAFIVNIFFGKRLPRQGDWISISAIILTLILSLSLFVGMLSNWDYKFSHEIYFSWIDLGAFKLIIGLIITGIISFFIFMNLYPDFLWFQSFGYESIWWFRVKSEWITWIIFTLIAFGWLSFNFC